jgi:hypothetical protein
MNSYYLKFIDEADARACLADFITEEGEWMHASPIHAMDVIGTVYKPTGESQEDDAGNLVPVLAPLEGFHVNFIGTLSNHLLSKVVTPNNPVRVWAS